MSQIIRAYLGPFLFQRVLFRRLVHLRWRYTVYRTWRQLRKHHKQSRTYFDNNSNRTMQKNAEDGLMVWEVGIAIWVLTIIISTGQHCVRKIADLRPQPQSENNKSLSDWNSIETRLKLDCSSIKRRTKLDSRSSNPRKAAQANHSRHYLICRHSSFANQQNFWHWPWVKQVFVTC